MPAKATKLITHTVLGMKDGARAPELDRELSFQIGEHIDDATVDLLRPAHANAMAIFDHNEHSCPPHCEGEDCPAAATAAPIEPPQPDRAPAKFEPAKRGGASPLQSTAGDAGDATSIPEVK
jgi:hypothetical protein